MPKQTQAEKELEQQLIAERKQEIKELTILNMIMLGSILIGGAVGFLMGEPVIGVCGGFIGGFVGRNVYIRKTRM